MGHYSQAGTEFEPEILSSKWAVPPRAGEPGDDELPGLWWWSEGQRGQRRTDGCSNIW